MGTHPSLLTFLASEADVSFDLRTHVNMCFLFFIPPHHEPTLISTLSTVPGIGWELSVGLTVRVALSVPVFEVCLHLRV